MYTVQSGSSVNQLQTFTTAMSSYFTNLASYLYAGSGTLPMFEDTIVNFNYSNIYLDATQGVSDNCSWRTGALAETVQLMAAIQREFNTRQSSKANYYGVAQTDMANDSNYYAALYAQYQGLYRGSSLAGS